MWVCVCVVHNYDQNDENKRRYQKYCSVPQSVHYNQFGLPILGKLY